LPPLPEPLLPEPLLELPEPLLPPPEPPLPLPLLPESPLALLPDPAEGVEGDGGGGAG